MSDTTNENESSNIQIHIPPDLEYLYRDISNVFVGPSDVVIEFGNLHRSAPGHASIANRVVLSIAGAYQLQHNLNKALSEAQQMMQKKSAT